MENGILIVASLNPNAKALFQVDRSQRRFTETTKLISKTKTLPRQSIRDLVLQTKTAGDEINNISDSNKKNDLQTKLNSSIDEYQAGLAASEDILASNNQTSEPDSNIAGQDPQADPTARPQASPSPTPLPTSSQPTARPTLRPTPTPTPLPPDCSKSANPIECSLNYCETIPDEVLAAQCYQDILDTLNSRTDQTNNQPLTNETTVPPLSETPTDPTLTQSDGTPRFQTLKNTLNNINIDDYIQMLRPD